MDLIGLPVGPDATRQVDLSAGANEDFVADEQGVGGLGGDFVLGELHGEGMDDGETSLTGFV